MNKLIVIFVIGLLSLLSFQDERNIYKGGGKITFVSSAPLETIKASSDQLKAFIDLSKRSFAFSIPVNTFQGFNSPLQREHFNEHYLETTKYPKSTFVGKILNFNDCGTACTIEVMAKGKLTIHGITKVVTLPVMIHKKAKGFSVNAGFEIQLSDYGIEIPLILEGKISPVIQVNVKSAFMQESTQDK